MEGKLLLFLGLVGLGESVYDWSYVGETGPDYWYKRYPVCGSGRQQSPINVNVDDVKYDVSLDRIPLTFKGYDVISQNAYWPIKNTGRTVSVDIHDEAFIAWGPLSTSYRVAGFHMHWGSHDSQGSEHTVNNDKYPLEIHIVHSMSQTRVGTRPYHGEGALAVVGILVEITDEDNKDLASFFDALGHITYGGTSGVMKPFLLSSLIPDIKSASYYTYDGSLTTPGCDEGVTWILMKKPLKISDQQMSELRRLKVGETGTELGKEPLVNNYRPTQPINDRIVRSNRST